MPEADFNAAQPAALRLIPETIARRHLVFPISEHQRRLVVASCNPGDLDAEQDIAFASGRTPVFVVAAPTAIEKAIDAHYSPEDAVEGILKRVAVDLTDDAEEASGEPHVLVVDDESVTRTLARALLEKQGMQVSEAENGIEALACLTSPGKYSMIVLDLDMPKMGGREVMARVRGSVATAALPIVVLTGSNDPIDEPQVLEAGADDYIRKPIDSHTFVARIRATLRRAAM